MKDIGSPLGPEKQEERAHLQWLEGCYRRRIEGEGCDTESDVFVAVVVQQNIQGQEEGGRVLKVLHQLSPWSRKGVSPQ